MYIHLDHLGNKVYRARVEDNNKVIVDTFEFTFTGGDIQEQAKKEYEVYKTPPVVKEEEPIEPDDGWGRAYRKWQILRELVADGVLSRDDARYVAAGQAVAAGIDKHLS